MERSFSILANEEDHGKRIDQFLAEKVLSLSRSQAKTLIERGHVLLNQRPIKPSTRLKSGDLISGILPKPQPLYIKPESIPLSILYEDSSLIVIDKPPGLVVHPAPGNPSGTLVNALLHHCNDLPGINGILRPGIVHRLDKDTSGVMVIAKDDEAYNKLVWQFKNRRVKKTYLAIVYGSFKEEEGVIDIPIGRHIRERKRMSIKTKKGREAITRWKVLEGFDGYSFLEIHPETGRTHQIRVHLASIGHPILGDPLYGRKSKPGALHEPVLRQCLKKIGRQALHSFRLEFYHPKTGEPMQFFASIPQDIEDVIELLRAKKKEK
ncbi:MAG: RluA family pseudouridine synthase [Thermodesulfobacteriota bacterium]